MSLAPERAAQRLAFLQEAGWGAAQRHAMNGDASVRSYERLEQNGSRAILMDAPPGCGDDLGDFLNIGAHLANLGLSSPRVMASDLALGLGLFEDLGDLTYGAAIAQRPGDEAMLMAEAAGVLGRLQAAAPPQGLPDLSAADWARSVDLAVLHYTPAMTGQAGDPQPLIHALHAALLRHADGPRVLILRDYHAGNLMWLPDRAGLARVGLLDFQLGQMGQPGYDLISLIQDARRDTAPEAAEAAIRRFAAERATTPAALAPALATLGAMRALRILGIFVRLAREAGKPGYLVHLPRVHAQLLENLRHPALAELAQVCARLIPAPTSEALARLERA